MPDHPWAYADLLWSLRQKFGPAIAIRRDEFQSRRDRAFVVLAAGQPLAWGRTRREAGENALRIVHA